MFYETRHIKFVLRHISVNEMARKFKHPKALREYWAKVKREYRAKKKTQAQQKGA